MDNRLKEIERISENQQEQAGGISHTLRYTKRVSVISWVRYDWKEAKEKAYSRALLECEKWHKKGKRAWVSFSGCEVTSYAYYVTHD